MPRQRSPLIGGGLGRLLPALLLLLGTGLLSGAYAQTSTVGSITGTVKDPNGAAISKAEVTVTNTATGFTRTTTADDAGLYSFPSLPVGTYTVSGSQTGFKKTVNSDIQLHVAENVVVNLVLQVGQVSETVTVTGDAAQIETRSGEISSLVGETQVTQLPINGRNYSNLVLLVPGMSPETRAGSGGAFLAKGVGLDGGVDVSSNGNGSNQNLWTVDGVNNMDVGSNRTLLVFPSVDSIAEFRVERNSYSAEFGQAQGAVINLITKGGSNQFHGGLWEFFRNDVLNATDTFLNEQHQKKGALRYNNFGGNFSGPIIKERLFFFWSEEWRRERRGVTNSGRVPTAQERVGDFSGFLTDTLPYDPLLGPGHPFPGNRIPANKISAVGEAYLATYPLPTCPTCSGNNWVGAPLEPVNNRQDEIRGDAIINSKTSLMVRWINETWTHANAAGNFWGDSPFPTVSSDWSQPSFSFAVKLTNTISSTAVNEFQFSRAGNDITVTSNPAGQPLLDAFTSKFPTVFPSPGKGFGYPTTWAGDGYTSLWHEAPWANHEDLFIWKDDFSKVKGAHDFKMGMLFSHNIKNEQINGDNGIYVIQDSNNRTGNYIADMLYLGLPFESYSEISKNVVDHGRWHDWEAYFNDTWKVRSNLTLSLGLRWSRYSAPYTATNDVSNYLPSLFNGTDPLSGLVLANSNGSILNSYGKGFQPRLGIAWDISGDGKTVLRLGVGRFISRTNVIEDLNRMAQNPPWAQTVNSNWGGNATSLTDPATRTWETIGATLPQQVAGVGPNTAFNAVNPNFKPPESWQWNVTLSHQLFKDTVIEASYVGNHALHLWRRGINYNDIVQSARAENAQLISTGADNTAFVAANRVFPGLGPVTLSDSSGDSHYHALQVWVNRRFSDRAAFQIAYTWSHAISNVPVSAFNSQTTDPFNYNLDRGDADLDRRQTFVADWVYQTPTLHNWGNSLTGQLGQKVLGDWQLNGIFSYFGGPPVYANISSGVNTAGLAAFPGAGFRPNTVPGVCLYNCSSGDGFQYLNPAAFALPAYGSFGQLGAGSIRLPSTWNVDFSVAKNFKFKERYGIQFRAELFNAFNHPQYNQADNSLSFQGLVTSPQYGQSLNGDFGRLTHDIGPREIQFGLKFNF